LKIVSKVLKIVLRVKNSFENSFKRFEIVSEVLK